MAGILCGPVRVGAAVRRYGTHTAAHGYYLIDGTRQAKEKCSAYACAVRGSRLGLAIDVSTSGSVSDTLNHLKEYKESIRHLCILRRVL